jgi:para-aminobenzoate synthetase component I
LLKVKEAVTFPINNVGLTKLKMLNWANQFSIFCFLDNNHYDFDTPGFECLLAAGSRHNLKASAGNAFEQLQLFSNDHRDEWIFGHLGYDLKNEIEQLQSENFDGIQFPDTHFFVPEFVLKLHNSQLSIYATSSAEDIFNAIFKTDTFHLPSISSVQEIQSRIAKPDYVEAVIKLQQHMLRGDCYEVNFCQEFFAEETVIDPVEVYKNLSSASPNPFAALYKMEDKYCISASPERYIKKSGNKIISQPIKGTATRNLYDAVVDERNKQELKKSEKERSENVMVVDLVRNDLSRVCKEGSVKVEELFGIYSFPQVHQMISSVAGEITVGVSWVDVVKATFPMGSMTGAPKKRVLELIETYEQTKRGLYSGAIGYVSPDGDFDFNVVIRSILYNATSKYLSFQAGSAVTYYSNAESEYNECLLKAEVLKKILK